MTKFMMLKMLLLVFMLLWLGTPAYAQVSTSRCITRIVDSGYCVTSSATGRLIYPTACCRTISQELVRDQKCMCKEVYADMNTAAEFIYTCDMDSSVIQTLCPGYKYAPSPSPGHQTNIIAIVVPIVIVVVLFIIGIVIICICRRQRKSKQNVSNDSHDNEAPSPATNKDDFITDESLQYEFTTLLTGTNNFSNDNVIGRGGFGFVYKGTLSDGQEIAVKRLSHGFGQGDKEFKTEIELLAKMQHRNVVRFLGFCLAEEEALLVYELVPNKSLDYFLFDNKKREELNWTTRFEIIKGIARGLLYLHEDSPLRTIHRDLKAGNVLLDANMNPKIADFGLARICTLEQTHVNATRVVGTRGYMSPEYLFHGQFSIKSDVYAFGVLVLEIISGRRVSSSFSNHQSGELRENLMSYAWRCWGDNKPLALMDPLLKDSYSSEEVLKCVQIGLQCVQDDINMRPNMSTIVHKLNSKLEDVVLSRPQFLYNSTSDQSTTSVTTQSVTVSSSPWSDVKNSR